MQLFQEMAGICFVSINTFCNKRALNESMTERQRLLQEHRGHRALNENNSVVNTRSRSEFNHHGPKIVADPLSLAKPCQEHPHRTQHS